MFFVSGREEIGAGDDMQVLSLKYNQIVILCCVTVSKSQFDCLNASVCEKLATMERYKKIYNSKRKILSVVQKKRGWGGRGKQL